MPSNHETGHAINVAKLLDFRELLHTFGNTYDPFIPGITLSAFSTLYITGRQKLDAVSFATNAWKMETNKREIMFDNLDLFCTSLMAFLKSTSAPQQTIDDFAALLAKIRGRRRRPIKPAAIASQSLGLLAPVKRTHSVAQRSFDMRLENFSKMVLLLKGVPDYAPNEWEFSIPGLDARLAELTTACNAASGSLVKLRAERFELRTFLYVEHTGALDLVQKAKAYIAGLYGRNSQNYKVAAAIQFVRAIPKNKVK